MAYSYLAREIFFYQGTNLFKLIYLFFPLIFIFYFRFMFLFMFMFILRIPHAVGRLARIKVCRCLARPPQPKKVFEGCNLKYMYVG